MDWGMGHTMGIGYASCEIESRDSWWSLDAGHWTELYGVRILYRSPMIEVIDALSSINPSSARPSEIDGGFLTMVEPGGKNSFVLYLVGCRHRTTGDNQRARESTSRCIIGLGDGTDNESQKTSITGLMPHGMMACTHSPAEKKEKLDPARPAFREYGQPTGSPTGLVLVYRRLGTNERGKLSLNGGNDRA